jgi:serine/threonine protein kinase
MLYQPDGRAHASVWLKAVGPATPIASVAAAIASAPVLVADSARFLLNIRRLGIPMPSSGKPRDDSEQGLTGNSGIRPAVAFRVARGVVVAGRYRLEREIGEGGMGVVWAARDLRTRRSVALKVIRGSSHSHAELRRRFRREARAASAVVHPNVVQVLDVFDLSEDSPVLVMELLEGETLAELLEREERLPLERCAELLVPAISAVGAAHARGIVHRDLKPSNIFLAKSAGGLTTVKVLDFGIAKLFVGEGEPGFTQPTRTGSTLGTPSYMAPEQATGQKDVDHLADVWAFGVILYECVSGIRPIEGDTVGQVVMSLMSTGITPLDQLVPNLPEAVARLTARMLSRERALRPRNLREPLLTLSRYTNTVAPDFGDPVSEPMEPDEGVFPGPTSGDGILGETKILTRRRAAFGVTALIAASAVVVFLQDRSHDGASVNTPDTAPALDTHEASTPGPSSHARAIEPRIAAPPVDTATMKANSPTIREREPQSAPTTRPAASAAVAGVSSATTNALPVTAPPPPEPPPARAPTVASAASPSSGFRGGLAEEVPF